MSNEGFREIQLNGKQLVFLFMAATVVLVVSFLCGVLVGRGVRETGTVAEMTSEVGPDSGGSTAVESAAPPPSVPQAAAPPTASTGTPPAREELSYAERLLRDVPPEETLKKTPAPPPAAPAPAPPPPETVTQPTAKPAPTPAPVAAAPAPPAAKPASTASPAAAVAASDPSGPGFAVQVMIFDTRQEADRLANQLVSKGYPAFVVNPAKGAAKAIYRVRVGKYRNRKDAEEILARLEKNEQFKPWIAR